MIRIHLLLLSFLLLGVGQTSFTQNVIIPRGSYIVNLGITPQTIGNGLKPYGLVYDLVTNYNVPVRWVFKQSKAKDANDFHHNGIFYKGSAFVIDSSFLTTTVKNRIATFWNAAAQGVVGAYTTYDTVLPVYNTITYWPKAVMDIDNGGLSAGYYSNAGIPTTSFRTGLPDSITRCEDMYIMPHADPTWAQYDTLYQFTRVNRGYIWGNCHSVSVLESNKHPTSNLQLNFLSSSGLQCYKNNECLTAVTETHAGAATSPTIDSSLSGDPLMQLVGNPIPPTNKGSEQWYIPVLTGRWNTDVKLYVPTADGSGNRKGSKIVAGYAYGNSNFGRVAYQAGHNFLDDKVTATDEERVAAQRVFLNFLLLTAIEKKPKLTTSFTITPTSTTTVFNATSSVTGGSPGYTYEWSSPCGNAIFSNTTSSSPTITVNKPANCRIQLLVRDACQRKNFAVFTAVSSIGAVLSEETLSLSAKRTNKYVQLDWNQPENKFYDQFSIERSYDGISFLPVSKTIANRISYTSIDQPDLTKKIVYYRLRTNENNLPVYSNTVIVKLTQQSNSTYLFPNPVKDFVQLMDLPINQSVQVAVYGIGGNKIMEKTLANSNGTYRLTLPESTQKGIYYLQVKTQDSFDVLKFFKE